MQGIYQIRNRANGKKYIGSSNDIGRRWRRHKRNLDNERHFNSHLQRAWSKYGKEGFVFEILKEVKGNKESLLAREQEYLDRGFELGNLYNTALDASAPMVGIPNPHTE